MAQMNKPKRGPALYNLETLIQAGIDPKTGLPLRMTDGDEARTKADIKAALRILDEQDAVNRYVWYNLPMDISSQELERLLYYKGQLCMFYCEPLGKFFVMPYALDGTIDFYGRFNTVHPVPMANGTTDDEKRMYKAQADYLSTLKLQVLYDFPEEPVDPTKVCVLIHDYTKQMSQTIIPRQQIMDPILDVEAECMPYMRTALSNSTGVSAMRVNSTDEESNVKAANISVKRAALSGQRYIPVLGNIDFQELAAGQVYKSEEFMMAMQSIDNFRLSLYGFENGGLFQKKAHMLQTEQQGNAGQSKSPLTDGLSIRQRVCDIANFVWGVGMFCEASETALGADTNGDGFSTDDKDQSGSFAGDNPEVNDNE